MFQRPRSGPSRLNTRKASSPSAPPDWGIIFLTLTLLVFGWVVLYSASALVAESRYGDQYYFLKKQVLWSVIGLAGLLAAMRIDLKLVQKLARPAYVIVGILLVLVLAMGHEVGGAKRWLRLGGLGVQPSEFAKLAVVLALADFLDRKQSRLKEFWTGFMPPLVVVGAALGLIALERDLGTPLLIALVSAGMIYVAGAKHRHLLGFLLAGVPVVFTAVFAVPYRRHRFFAFLDPWKDAQGTGYQLVQSLLALGSGGFWGKGSGESTIKMYYLPESQTDFVFSIFGEEFGFLGTSFLTLVFFYLAWRCFRVGMRASTLFGSMTASGVALLLGGQVLLNLFVVTGLMPTKGMPLPFISFGGSSLVALLVSVGLVLNVSRRQTGVALEKQRKAY